MQNLRGRRDRQSITLLLFFASLVFTQVSSAQQVSPDTFQAMRWRLIGPHRAGRVSAVAGVPGQPAIYYIGTPGGGVWKTTDAGRVWKPIFDHEHLASIGALVVAPSNPNIILVGTGEQTQGNGIYRSTDAGATWTNIGLQQTHIITGMFVDPKDPNIIVVAAAGDRTSAAERGIFRTTDGGKNWKKVLYKDDNTGPMDLTSAPDDPKVLYTAFQIRRQGPPQSATQQKPEQDGSIYKSVDEGTTWTAVAGTGLPAEPMGRLGVGVAPGNHGKTVYAIATQGLFRSSDGGTNWSRSTSDPRILGNGYFSKVFVDPKNPKAVYVAQTAMYRSLDGGQKFDAFFGAPSGDDIHMIWINPQDTRYMLLGVDQGAVVSVDSGETWTEWYNQPTGQFYHVIADNQFPYYVYAAQQDSGTAAVPSRSDYGEITYRDWAPSGGFEFAYIAPDPADPNYVYIGGWYGSVLRYDKRTGQVVHVFVQSAKYHTYSMAPIVFSPQNPHTMFIGAQYVLKTNDAGAHFEEVSPDLTAKGDQNAGGRRGRQAAITTLAPSTLVEGEMWAGTSNGQISVTRDGKNWQNVTPSGLPERCTIETVEASHHDAGTAYAVAIAQQDSRPYAFRTHAYGKTWQAITNGFAENGIGRVIRDDPARKGLLYAGTENAVYVSFDDGDHWQALQLNLPTSSMRDLAVHGDDLVVATYGRALWILDDLSPLRQWDATSAKPEALLLKPEGAIRTRWDMNQDTPLPPETPAGENPPDGAILDYYLKSAPAGEMKLAIYDAQNTLVREYSSIPPPEDKTPKNAPDYWFEPPAALSKNPGHNRFVWNMRYPAPKALRYSYYGNPLDYIEYTLADHSIPGETPHDQPFGPLVVPGEYTVALTVNGQTFRQPLTVTLDPRVKVSQADLQQQLDAEKSISAQMSATYAAVNELKKLSAQIKERETSLEGKSQAQGTVDQLKQLDKTLDDLENGTPPALGLGSLNRELARLATQIESGDAKPAAELQNGVDQSCQQTVKRLAEWTKLTTDVSSANVSLQRLNQQALTLGNAPAAPVCAR